MSGAISSRGSTKSSDSSSSFSNSNLTVAENGCERSIATFQTADTERTRKHGNLSAAIRHSVRRDIKSENIGIRFPPASEGDDVSDNHENWMKVKLIDFGLSTYAKSGLATTPCGTLGYMAPEILFIGQYECECTSAVDIWAFGCLLYILLTGAPPFELGIVPQSKLDVVVSYSPSIWSKVPANAQQAVEACLNPNPETRITAAKFLDLEWF
ncbi:kinase-like domain-containing protein, partial [Chytriomyces cf. hyalinus JEL632]